MRGRGPGERSIMDHRRDCAAEIRPAQAVPTTSARGPEGVRQPPAISRRLPGQRPTKPPEEPLAGCLLSPAPGRTYRLAPAVPGTPNRRSRSGRLSGVRRAEVPLARARNGGGRRLGVESEDHRTLLRAGVAHRRPGNLCACPRARGVHRLPGRKVNASGYATRSVGS